MQNETQQAKTRERGRNVIVDLIAIVALAGAVTLAVLHLARNCLAIEPDTIENDKPCRMCRGLGCPACDAE